ncbi:hypothetical protein ANN_25466 [Periplaneta americana]|uniref:Uncharacterized protein n=1 Tax=Periplaneta americana TaxID=6978 RepID=A0ABQ8S1D5_PERAM|nr:hypothetical protein ANN_25466 [Periplaneta americana]
MVGENLGKNPTSYLRPSAIASSSDLIGCLRIEVTEGVRLFPTRLHHASVAQKAAHHARELENACEHVKREEDFYWERDGTIDKAVDRFVISLDSDSDNMKVEESATAYTNNFMEGFCLLPPSPTEDRLATEEVRAVEIKLDSLPGSEAQLLRDKFGKNSGYKKMCKVAQVLEDVPVETNHNLLSEELTGSRQIHVEAELSHLFRIPRIPSVSLHNFEGHQDCDNCAMLGRGDRMELSELFVQVRQKECRARAITTGYGENVTVLRDDTKSPHSHAPNREAAQA